MVCKAVSYWPATWEKDPSAMYAQRGHKSDSIFGCMCLKSSIKDKLIDLINRTFIRENTQYLACNEECTFFTSDMYNNHNLWSCQNVCDAVVYLLDNIFIRFWTKLYRQLLVFRWELIVLLLLQICFVFVMREISWSLFHVKFRLTLLRLSIQLQDTLTIY